MTGTFSLILALVSLLLWLEKYPLRSALVGIMETICSLMVFSVVMAYVNKVKSKMMMKYLVILKVFILPGVSIILYSYPLYRLSFYESFLIILI